MKYRTYNNVEIRQLTVICGNENNGQENWFNGAYGSLLQTTFKQSFPCTTRTQILNPEQLASNTITFVYHPENNLHIREQYDLGIKLAKAAARDCQIIVNTNSDMLILGIQTAVAENIIQHDTVVFHWFYINQDTQKITIESCNIDRAGRTGDWRCDFLESRLVAQQRFLNAASTNIRDR